MVRSSRFSGTMQAAWGIWRERDGEHLLGRRHLEIERQTGGLLDPLEVAVADMAPVLAQMRGDPVAADRGDDLRRAHRVGVIAAARVADGGDVIDVDAQPQRRRLRQHRRVRIGAGRLVQTLRLPGLVIGIAASSSGSSSSAKVGKLIVEQGEEGDPEIERIVRTIDQRDLGDHLAAFARHGGDRLAARQAGGDDILHHQHLLARLDPEAAAQVERRPRAARERPRPSRGSARPHGR